VHSQQGDAQQLPVQDVGGLYCNLAPSELHIAGCMHQPCSCFFLLPQQPVEATLLQLWAHLPEHSILENHCTVCQLPTCSLTATSCRLHDTERREVAS
jgi:hypothetical protein